MSIKSITIGNFKGIRDKVKIDLKPVTLLFGQNSGGKSTIIQALHYAWEVMVRHNLDPNFTELGGKEIDLGGFENIVYGHELSRSISIRLDMDFKDKILPKYGDEVKRAFDEVVLYGLGDDSSYDNNLIISYWDCKKEILNSWIEIAVSWNEKTNKLQVSSYDVGLNDELIATVRYNPNADKVNITYINFFHPLLVSINSDFEKLKADNDGSSLLSQLMRLIKKIGTDPDTWMDKNIFSAEQYNEFIEISENLLNHLKRYTVLSEKQKILANKNDPKSEEKRSQLATKMCELLETWDDDNIIAPFLPYAFLFFCFEAFNIESINEELNIECSGLRDALPDWETPFRLQFKSDAAKYYAAALESAIMQFIIGPGQILRDELKKLHYLGPIRSRIPRDYVPNRFTKNLNWADGMAAWGVLHKEDEEFIRQVDDWLADLNSGYRMIRKSYKEIDISEVESGNANSEKIVQQFNSAPTKTRLFLKDEKNGVEVQPPDVGTGISQVLPVIVSALYFKEGVVAIEQPELHLHPALQAEIGDVFLQSALGENHNRFLIETHSEHLLLRIMRRMRETAFKELPKGYPHVTPDDVTVLFVEAYESRTIVREMPLNKHGELVKAWPGGFFEEGLREVF